MRFLAAVVCFLLPLGGLAGKHYESPLRPSRRHAQAARSLETRNNTGTVYKLQDYYRGKSFLNDWDFFSAADPTHGNVNYQTRDNAVKKNLAYVQKDGTTVLAVDDFSTVPVGGKRDSVRISSKKTYNGGLFIADFWKMPHGCSVWPAYWSVGPNWPSGGKRISNGNQIGSNFIFFWEIDILEGVHEQATNQYTLHSGEGCSLSTDSVRLDSSVVHDQCASSGSDNRGCGFLDGDTRSYGKPFNMIAGGVFAHLWNNEGIKMWHFARGEIPADIDAKQPNPDTWPTPVAFFSSKTCDMASHFYEHSLVLDTTICGDFGGPTYAGSGCPGTCAEATANSTIFQWAKWKVNYIAVYDLL